MAEEDQSDLEIQENGSDSSYEELETPRNGGNLKMSGYEKERMKRIAENIARMEALGLPKMASTVMGSAQKKNKKSEPKGKAKMVDEDEEYRPPEEEECLMSSSEEDDDDYDDDDDDEEFVGKKSTAYQSRKVKKNNSNVKKKLPVQKVVINSDFTDEDDEALLKAIALSLRDSSESSDVVHGGPSRRHGAQMVDGMVNERKENSHIQEDARKRKRKKQISARVQMTEDELVVHFCQFDEAGKGSISLRDIRRIATDHDFTWTDQEMADMICIFDSDGDGKLTLDDFRKIVARCNMIQGSENFAMGSKS